jgi:hypothetical protein
MTKIKAVLIVLLLIFIFTDLKEDSVSSASLDTVSQKVYEASGFSSDMEPAENRMVRRFYGLNPNDYEGVVLYAPEDNMDANELLIVKLKDTSQSEEVEAAIQERLETQKKSFDGYGAVQTQLLNNSILKVKGNFVFYMVGENAAEAESVFLSAIKD